MSDAVTGEVVDPEVEDLQRAYAEIAGKPYKFTWVDRTWTVPHLRELDYRLQAEIEGLDEIGLDEIKALFGRIFDAQQAAAWDQVQVPAPFMLFLFDKWIKHSGGKQGEEKASEPSSESTGANSKPTSDASTDSGSPKPSTAKRAPRKAASRRASSST